MTELPETYTFVDQINATLPGKRVRRAEAAHTPHGFAWYTGDPASYDGILSGKTVTQADVLGGALRVHLDDRTLLLSAPPRYHAPGAKLPEKHQLLLEFDDGSAMTCSVLMWGSMFLYHKGTEETSLPDDYTLSFKPNPYDDAFTLEYFLDMAHACPGKLSVKALLATEQRISGFGNGCLHDVLWTARLNPRRRISETTEEQLIALYHALMAVMGEMRAKGGRDTERDLFGKNGGYRTICSSKHSDDPCPSCGGFILREAYLGGNVYYCPVCQPYEKKKGRG